MSRRIALVEHQRPRILTIDFTEAEVTKIRNLGFNIRSGFTGLRNNNQFSIPWAVEDVEIVFARVSSGSFSKVEERTRHESSVELTPQFVALMREVWLKGGWAILFVEQACNPTEPDILGVEGVGVLTYNQRLYSVRTYTSLVKEFPEAKKKVVWTIPRYKSEAVRIVQDEIENSVLERYLHQAKMSILAVDNNLGLSWTSDSFVDYLILGESATGNVLALKFRYRDRGKILLLPDFGKSTVDVSIGLLQEVIQDKSPSLFDSPEHPWLENYLPHSVNEIRESKNRVKETALAELKTLDEAEQSELEKFNWLLGLLTSTGDEFRDNAANALRFLGFTVEVVDDAVPQGQPLKEDLHIFDKAANYEAIGETKSTKRGASESFITDVQNHQGRFSREHNVRVPDAMLIVNHSYGFDPAQRAGRFYQHPDLINRCREQAITAIDSVALYQMCQSVLSGKAGAESIRKYLTDEHRVIMTFDPGAITTE